jgi:hypothetical protein
MTEVEAGEAPILGLFASEREADAALSALHRQSLGGEAIKVVDKATADDVDPSLPLPVRQAGASLGPLRGGVEHEPEVTPESTAVKISALETVLMRLSLSREEAHYYARNVYDGASLIIVPGATQRERVVALLREHGAANL